MARQPPLVCPLRPAAMAYKPPFPKGLEIIQETQNGCSEAKSKSLTPWQTPRADALAKPTYIENPDSGELHRPHHVDLKSGMYRGRQVLDPRD